MKLSRLLTTLVAALLCAALVAGCGGGPSKEDYEKSVKKIGNEVEKDIDALGNGQPSAKDIEAAQESIDEAADDIDELEPPEEVEKLHEDLVETLHDTAELLGRLSPLMEKAAKDSQSMGDEEMKRMNEVTADFGEIQEEMNRITEGYAKKDYDIGLGEADDSKKDDSKQ